MGFYKMLPPSQRRPWRERIRHFTWSWFAMIMGTGILSTLAHIFPYGGDSKFFTGLCIFFFALNTTLFGLVMAATIARYSMFPEVWSLMLRHPAQSLFIGCFPMGAATLINSGLILNQSMDFGGTPFLYFLWVMWWMDSILSFLIAFGMIYAMATRQDQSLAKMTSVWILPVVSLIVASSSGGNMATALKQHSTTLATISAALSLTMVSMGLSLALMMITGYLLRLVIHGPPEPALVLSAFIPLGPLGQGGYSLLVSGQALQLIFPIRGGDPFAIDVVAGKAFQIVLFCGSYVLWSMGLAWIIIACWTIFEVGRKTPLPFGMGYWGLIFPNGVFAVLSVQLGRELQSPFFKVFGSMWSIITFLIWVYVFVQTIPRVIDGTIFKAPYIPDSPVVTKTDSIGGVENGHSASTTKTEHYMMAP